LKIEQKLPLKNSKLEKKNSNKKLRVREALASFLCPSDVKKSPIYTKANRLAVFLELCKKK